MYGFRILNKRQNKKHHAGHHELIRTKSEVSIPAECFHFGCRVAPNDRANENLTAPGKTPYVSDADAPDLTPDNVHTMPCKRILSTAIQSVNQKCLYLAQKQAYSGSYPVGWRIAVRPAEGLKTGF